MSRLRRLVVTAVALFAVAVLLSLLGPQAGHDVSPGGNAAAAVVAVRS